MERGDGVDVNSVVAFSSAAAAMAALVVALVTCFQLKHARFALGVDLVLKLEAQFDAPEMKTARSLAAKALSRDTNAVELEPVLDFFETVGALLKRRAVDGDLAWSCFSYWVLRYAALASDQIRARRKADLDQTYYQEFEFLVEQMERVEGKKRHLKSVPPFSHDSLVSFLEEETTD